MELKALYKRHQKKKKLTDECKSHFNLFSPRQISQDIGPTFSVPLQPSLFNIDVVRRYIINISRDTRHELFAVYFVLYITFQFISADTYNVEIVAIINVFCQLIEK